jgi:hypothetical protein
MMFEAEHWLRECSLVDRLWIGMCPGISQFPNVDLDMNS